mmetsp:Transcript_49546/g.116322  ORF Transcript_49546/g.116322 Transcript_49546/m.116322 type:complete len:316 (+) Transcript_49546:753-1700(+)
MTVVPASTGKAVMASAMDSISVSDDPLNSMCDRSALTIIDDEMRLLGTLTGVSCRSMRSGRIPSRRMRLVLVALGVPLLLDKARFSDRSCFTCASSPATLRLAVSSLSWNTCMSLRIFISSMSVGASRSRRAANASASARCRASRCWLSSCVSRTTSASARAARASASTARASMAFSNALACSDECMDNSRSSASRRARSAMTRPSSTSSSIDRASTSPVSGDCGTSCKSKCCWTSDVGAWSCMKKDDSSCSTSCVLLRTVRLTNRSSLGMGVSRGGGDGGSGDSAAICTRSRSADDRGSNSDLDDSFLRRNGRG